METRTSTLVADTLISFNYTSAYVSNFPARCLLRYLEKMRKTDSCSQVLMTMMLAPSLPGLLKGLLLPNLKVVAAAAAVCAATSSVVDTRRTPHKHH
jgi:hypothetical protein